MFSKASTQEAIMNNLWYKRHTGQHWKSRGHAHCSGSFAMLLNMIFDTCQHVDQHCIDCIASIRELQGFAKSKPFVQKTNHRLAAMALFLMQKWEQMQDAILSRCKTLWNLSYFDHTLSVFCFFRTESRIGQDSLEIPTSGRVEVLTKCSIRLKRWAQWAPVDFCVVYSHLKCVSISSFQCHGPWIRDFDTLNYDRSKITGFVNVPVMPQSMGKIVRLGFGILIPSTTKGLKSLVLSMFLWCHRAWAKSWDLDLAFWYPHLRKV